MKLLALSGVLTALMTNAGAVFLAVGQPRKLALLAGLYVAVLLITIIPLANMYGPIGAAWAYIVASLIANPVQYWVLFRDIKLPLSDFLQAMWRPLLSSALMYVSVDWLIHNTLAGPTVNDWLALVASIVAGGVIYIAIVSLLWLMTGKPDGAENDLIKRIWPAVRKRLSL